MPVLKSSLPDTSVLKQNGETFHYADSFQSRFTDPNQTIGPTEVGKAFFAGGPAWVEGLFKLRNKIGGWLGLKTSGKMQDRKQALENFKCEPGEQLGLFKVYNKTDREVILGEDDKHLDFRISLFIRNEANSSERKTLIISTTVRFNHWIGRLYFLPVRLFHRIIVPTMLKGMVKELEKQTVNQAMQTT